jgi:hypothetical protein
MNHGAFARAAASLTSSGVTSGSRSATLHSESAFPLGVPDRTDVHHCLQDRHFCQSKALSVKFREKSTLEPN